LRHTSGGAAPSAIGAASVFSRRRKSHGAAPRLIGAPAMALQVMSYRRDDIGSDLPQIDVAVLVVVDAISSTLSA
jgi:hypothetical protein